MGIAECIPLFLPCHLFVTSLLSELLGIAENLIQFEENNNFLDVAEILWLALNYVMNSKFHHSDSA